MVAPRFDGAQVPQIPGGNPVGGFPSAVRAPQPRYATGYLQNIAQKAYRERTLAYLASGGKQGEGFVYTGEGRGYETRFSRMAGKEYRLATPKHATIQSKMADFEYMSAEEKRTLARKLFMAGFLPDPAANLMDLQEAYANLLSSASARYAQGQQITPNDLLEQNIHYNLAAAGIHVKGDLTDKSANKWFKKLQANGADSKLGRAAGASASAQSPDLSGKFTTHSTNKSVDIYSPEDAKGLIRATLQRELDRDPTQAEFEDFVAALQTKSRENPQITHTTTTETRDRNGNVINTNTSNRSTGGFDSSAAEEFATETAQAKPGWAEWQAMGTYFPALLQALGSAVPGT